MSDEILYDIDRHDYPNERGDSFRSVQTFKCWVCGALTNRVVMGGYPGYGIRVICPNSCDCWHHVLEHKLGWLDRPHPADYKRALREEIETFQKKYADRIKNDIVGTPRMSDFGHVTNTLSSRRGTFCQHFFLPGKNAFDESSIERAERAIETVKRLGPCAPLEKLISEETLLVKTHVRQLFYGNDAHAVLFPEDEFGPSFNDDLEKRLLISKRSRGIILKNVFQDPNLKSLKRAYLMFEE